MKDFKIAIIEGKEDGKLEIRGTGEDLHAKCLLEYAKDHYKEYPIFQTLTVRHQPETISYFLQDLGNIVLLNTTHHDKKERHFATVFLPKTVTKSQKETLYTLVEELNLKSFSIAYDLTLKDGIVEGKEKYMTIGKSAIDLLDEYFQSEKIEKEHK